MIDNPLLIGLGIGFGMTVGSRISSWAVHSLTNIINGAFENMRYRAMGVSEQVILDHVPRMERRGPMNACRKRCPICTDLGLVYFDPSQAAYPPWYPSAVDSPEPPPPPLT
jgi:hypothetical protein